MATKVPTLREVARKAGVSAMTVSRVFRQDPAVRPATAALVRRIAKKLRYEPDQNLGRALTLYKLKRTQGRAGTIAFLRCVDATQMPGEKIPGVSVADVRFEAARLGFGLDLIEVENNLKSVRHTRQVLIARGIHAIIIVPRILGHAIEQFDFEGFHTVAIGYGLAHPDLSRVCTSMVRSVMECVSRLAGQGNKRIGLALSRFEDERVNFGFSGGYLAGMSHLEGGQPETVLWIDSIPLDVRPAQILQWARSEKLDGILSTVLLPPHKDISACVSLDWNAAWKGYPGIDHRRDIVAAQAVTQILFSLTLGSTGVPATPLTVLIPPRLVGFAS